MRKQVRQVTDKLWSRAQVSLLVWLRFTNGAVNFDRFHLPHEPLISALLADIMLTVILFSLLHRLHTLLNSCMKVLPIIVWITLALRSFGVYEYFVANDRSIVHTRNMNFKVAPHTAILDEDELKQLRMHLLDLSSHFDDVFSVASAPAILD